MARYQDIGRVPPDEVEDSIDKRVGSARDVGERGRPPAPPGRERRYLSRRKPVESSHRTSSAAERTYTREHLTKIRVEHDGIKVLGRTWARLRCRLAPPEHIHAERR
jgi:hypothetical protein